MYRRCNVSNKWYVNGCILRVCGFLAALAFLFGAFAFVGQQIYARIFAYTADIPAGESAGIVLGMNIIVVIAVCVAPFLSWAAWRAR